MMDSFVFKNKHQNRCSTIRRIVFFLFQAFLLPPLEWKTNIITSQYEIVNTDALMFKQYFTVAEVELFVFI